MSRFVDMLRRFSKTAPQSMGFRSTQPVSVEPRMLLIASFAQMDIEGLAERVVGADAGLLHITSLSSGTDALGKVTQAVPDIPWGGLLRDVAGVEVGRIMRSGFDFMGFPPAGTPLATLKDNKVGKILEAETSLSEDLLRAVDDLPLDAVLVADEQDREYFLTWQHLMVFQRYANLLTKPLLVYVPSGVSASELQALWEAGVNGVVVGVETGQSVGKFKELREVIDKLVFPSQRKWRKAEALLPHIHVSEEAKIDAEEE